MTTATNTHDRNAPDAVGFSSTFSSEWAKLLTLRSARRNLVLGALLGLAVSIALSFVIGETHDSWSAVDRAEFDPLLYPLTGGILTSIFFAAVGVNAMAAEYSSGMIRLTLIATPHRHRVIMAKALVLAMMTGLAGLAVMLGMIGLSQVVFHAYGLPMLDPTSSGVARVMILGTLTTPLFPIVAMCLTVLTRTTAAALTTVLVAMFVPSVLGATLPRWWQEHLMVLLPGPASDALATGHLTDSDTYLHPIAAAMIVTTWIAVMLGTAIAAFTRRDA